MIRVLDLSYGWSLCGEWNTRTERRKTLSGVVTETRTEMDMSFRHRDGRARNPYEFASLPEAREVFRAMKRQLDVMDNLRIKPGMDFAWNAVDRAVLALRLSLDRKGRWADDLMDTDLEVIEK